MSDPDSRESPNTIEVEAVQILEERSRRPPPPLPGSTVEVQAVQILAERPAPAQDGTGKAQVVHLHLEDELAAASGAPIFRMTTEEVDWRRLDPLDADLLVRFSFGATVDAIVAAGGVEPERAREAIDRLIRAGLLVS